MIRGGRICHPLILSIAAAYLSLLGRLEALLIQSCFVVQRSSSACQLSAVDSVNWKEDCDVSNDNNEDIPRFAKSARVSNESKKSRKGATGSSEQASSRSESAKQKRSSKGGKGSGASRSRAGTVAKARRKRSRSTMFDASRHHRDQLVSHKLLSASRERELGALIQRAIVLQENLSAKIKAKQAKEEQKRRKRFDGTELDEIHPINPDIPRDRVSLGDDDPSSHISIHEPSEADIEESLYSFPEVTDMSDVESTSYAHNRNLLRNPSILDEVDDLWLTDEEIKIDLELAGGRQELRKMLREGEKARDELIRCNIRLVVSIANDWAKRAPRSLAPDSNMFSVGRAGRADRPSLDEAIQEGILGLTKAAERYDPSRGLRFSTYGHFWVTSYVRKCFRTFVTGSLKIPLAYHDIKLQYKTEKKRFYEQGLEEPSDEEIAKRIGVSLRRMKTALRLTRPLVSLDTPVNDNWKNGYGSSGGDVVDDVCDTLSDFIPCTERLPAEQVELSLLRQCLENAMAAELNPHERDVVRLRLGLDDGVSRTVKEIVQVCGGSVRGHEVRATERRAYKKLRSPAVTHTRHLKAYKTEELSGSS